MLDPCRHYPPSKPTPAYWQSERSSDMQDRQLYAQILGITVPWSVVRVELKLAEEQAVHIYLEHDANLRFACPECGLQCMLHDHQPERRWRHLDTCQYQTILHAAPPRTNCPEHGPKVVKLPWAGPSSRFTALFERLVIDWLKVASQSAVAAQLGLSWDEVHAILARAVERGLERRQAEPIPHLGVDEKSFRKRHRYLTLMNDLDRHRVLYVAEGRRKQSLDGFFQSITEEQRTSIQAVAMDMWDPYVSSVKEHVEAAEEKIVFDKFHIAAHVGEAVDKVRREENKQLRERGDNSLTGTKYLWLRNAMKLAGKLSDEVATRFESLRATSLKTARAWAMKETLMALFGYQRKHAARAFYKGWHKWAMRSRLKPMKAVAKMLKRRLELILNYCRHRITNARSEALNTKIQWVKATARGYRNQQNFINAIYFHCGALDLNP